MLSFYHTSTQIQVQTKIEYRTLTIVVGISKIVFKYVLVVFLRVVHCL